MDLYKLRVEDIMIRDFVTADSSDKVANANLKMVRKGIGGLPVVDESRLVGIITHRDIVLSGENVMGLHVGDIMTKDVRTVESSATIKDVVKLMSETGYQRIPVTEKGRLVGMVTQSCIINALSRCL
ncbi:MAG: CBS domain-containing protein [Methanobacteriota archaeon]|nr:MAG: CBS domain-containing protein [Euryarchaeota archaeon]